MSEDAKLEELRMQVAIGELAAAHDYIQRLKVQLVDAGLTPVQYVGPRGYASYQTDNHFRPVHVERQQLEVGVEAAYEPTRGEAPSRL